MFVVVRFVKYNTSIASVKFAQTLLLWHDKSNDPVFLAKSIATNPEWHERLDMNILATPPIVLPLSLSTIKKECHSFISFSYIHIINYIDIFLIWHGICFTKTTPLAAVIFMLPRPARGRFDAWSSERVRSWSLTGEVRNPEVDSPGAWCWIFFSVEKHGRYVGLMFEMICFYMIWCDLIWMIKHGWIWISFDWFVSVFLRGCSLIDLNKFQYHTSFWNKCIKWEKFIAIRKLIEVRLEVNFNKFTKYLSQTIAFANVCVWGVCSHCKKTHHL